MDYEETICHMCENGDDEHLLMLCDGCDRGFHTYCVNLDNVPEGDWYCVPCSKKKKKINTKEKKTVEPKPEPKPEKVKKPEPKWVWIYERVSTKGQDNPEFGRDGLNTQNDGILDYCRSNGYTIRGTITEVGSAFKGKTPELDKLIDNVKKNEPILVHSFSRFSRNYEHCMTKINKLHQKESYVVSVSQNKTSLDPVFPDIIKAAEDESKNSGIRIKASHVKTLQQGGYIGRKPFGYNIVRENGIRRLKENVQELVLVNRIKSMFHEKKKTVPEIVYVMNNKFPSYKWNKYMVSRIIHPGHKLASNFKRALKDTFVNDLAASLDEIDQEFDMVVMAYPEAILDIVQNNKGKDVFLVKWVDSEETTFENMKNFNEDVPELVKNFFKNNTQYKKSHYSM